MIVCDLIALPDRASLQHQVLRSTPSTAAPMTNTTCLARWGPKRLPTSAGQLLTSASPATSWNLLGTGLAPMLGGRLAVTDPVRQCQRSLCSVRHSLVQLVAPLPNLFDRTRRFDRTPTRRVLPLINTRQLRWFRGNSSTAGLLLLRTCMLAQVLGPLPEQCQVSRSLEACRVEDAVACSSCSARWHVHTRSTPWRWSAQALQRHPGR